MDETIAVPFAAVHGLLLKLWYCRGKSEENSPALFENDCSERCVSC